MIGGSNPSSPANRNQQACKRLFLFDKRGLIKELGGWTGSFPVQNLKDNSVSTLLREASVHLEERFHLSEKPIQRIGRIWYVKFWMSSKGKQKPRIVFETSISRTNLFMRILPMLSVLTESFFFEEILPLLVPFTKHDLKIFFRDKWQSFPNGY